MAADTSRAPFEGLLDKLDKPVSPLSPIQPASFSSATDSQLDNSASCFIVGNQLIEEGKPELAKNYFQKGDIILDSELNLIGGKLMLIFNYYKIKFYEAWKRYLYRIAIQPNIYLKFKEFINTIIFLLSKK